MIYAVIENSIVVNVLVIDDDFAKTLDMDIVNIGSLPVGIGDEYIDGKFISRAEGKEGMTIDPTVKDDPTQEPTVYDYLLDLDYRLSLKEMNL